MARSIGKLEKFKLNRAGVRELMRSKEMSDICMGYANDAVSKLGEGYSANAYTGKNRANATVGARSMKARRENLESNTILKAVFG